MIAIRKRKSGFCGVWAFSASSAGGQAHLNLQEVARQLWAPNFLNAWRAVQYIESHDEVYRDRGQRLPRLADAGNPRSLVRPKSLSCCDGHPYAVAWHPYALHGSMLP